MFLQNWVNCHHFVLKILSGNEIPTSIKGHKKLMHTNPKQGVFNINAYAKFCQIQSIVSQDIER